ncbi:hypothetical protein KC343_g2251 [Hortaea werneckii]|nr:hypothetical protein KC352_g7392 [Hortaea werneckii]KAI7571966.1 hypothetical protein KC317_g1173 [Hortaea werneckii]KAI7625020.1 hypothetical protein KC346_g1929 [Hortaea werneckii]KAI7634728.1 hypothetical protein KC343_g2251 [Hortaea werneckii]KAI7679536.1 hypothetical protein KC319_g2708 [Hortaea werneckii]
MSWGCRVRSSALLRAGSDDGSSRSKQGHHHQHQQREVIVAIEPARTPLHSDTDEPKMQSTRFLAANMLRAQPSRMTPMLRTQQATRGFRTVGRQMRPMPKEDQSAHTISQRLRQLKRIPPELIPLGVVLAAAVFAAGYSIVRKLFTDSTLRLYRQGPDANKH